MALQPMSPGGRWMRPPHDGPAVYVPARQIESHYKRLVGDNWMPIDDPRTDDGTSVLTAREQAAPLTSREVSMQAQIDRLTVLVQSLLAQKEQSHGSEINDVGPDHENTPDDRRPNRRKSAV